MPIPRRLLVVLAASVLLGLVATAPEPATAASCAGNSHAMKLSNGSAAPGRGTTATKFTFSITYTDNSGCVPDRIVVVVVGGGTFDLSYVGGGLRSGATFARTVPLPAGSWAYRFEASSGSGAGRRSVTLTNVAPTKVVVKAAAAAPTPKPAVTAAPTPRRIPAPTKPAPSPRGSKAPPPTPSEATPVATADWTPLPTVVPAPTTFVSASAFSNPSPPVAALKFVVASIATVGGLVLFRLLSGIWLRPIQRLALPPVPRRRRDDQPTHGEPAA